MSRKDLREYLNKMPPALRQKMASVMTNEAAEKNAALVAEQFELACDAILNQSVVAFATAEPDEVEQVVRFATFPIVVIKACEQIITHLLPSGGPRESVHKMLTQMVEKQLPDFDKTIRELLPKGVIARANVRAGKPPEATEAWCPYPTGTPGACSLLSPHHHAAQPDGSAIVVPGDPPPRNVNALGIVGAEGLSGAVVDNG